MPVSDFTNTVMRQPVQIVTCDPVTNRIEGRLKDGGIIQIAGFGDSPFYRWPAEGELWNVIYQNNIPRLDGYVEQEQVVKVPSSSLKAGEARIEASLTKFGGSIEALQDLKIDGASSFKGRAIFDVSPRAPTPPIGTNDTTLATTAFVVSKITPLAGVGYLANNQTWTGTNTFAVSPVAPTLAVDTNTTQVATTAYVIGQGYLKASTAASTYAPIASPTFTGVATIPTAAVTTFTGTPDFTGNATAITQTAGNSSTRIATTAFVAAAVAGVAGSVTSVFGRTGAVVAASGDYAVAQVTGAAPLASPTFTGTPVTTTAAVDTNTTQIASTAFVLGQAGGSAPLMAGAAAAGTSSRYSRQDHIHPVDTSRSPVAGSSSIVTLGTVTTGIWNSTAIAETYIDTAIARLASPTFTGTVTIPTVAGTTDSTTKAASTAFVQAVVSASTPTGVGYLANAQTWTNTNTFSGATGVVLDRGTLSTAPVLTLTGRNGSNVASSATVQVGTTGTLNYGVPTANSHIFNVAGSAALTVNGGSATFAGSLAITGALTGATTGAFSGLITSTNNSGALDASATSGTMTGTGTSTGDKVLLYGGAAASGNQYGFGIGTNRLVAFMPPGAGFAIRATATTGDLSSGSPSTVLLLASGYVNVTGGYQVSGTALAASHLSNGVTGTGAVVLASAISGFATDSAVVHLAGTETISGAKTFSAVGTALAVTNNLTVGGTLTGMTNVTGTGTTLALSTSPVFVTPTLGAASATSLTLTTALAIGQGGTGQTTAAAAFDALSAMTTLGDFQYGGAAGTRTRLPGTTSATKQFLTQTGNGSVSAAPAWGTIAAADVPNLGAAIITSGILAATVGGTGSGFTAFTGPTTSTKTFTLPDATATILTTNTAVTVAQGGTGAGTAANARTNLGLVIGTDVQAYNANTTLLGNTTTGSGSVVLATSPVLVTPTLGVASATSLALSGALTGATTGAFSSTVTAADPTASNHLATKNYVDSAGRKAFAFMVG